jgi:putative transposase
MANHYHLLVETTAADLSRGMQEVNGRYAQLFNHWHCFDGHLFQGRFYSSPVETDSHLLELVRYVSLNPVRAGVCNDPADWRWSSYPALAGFVGSPRFLAAARTLSLFGPERRAAQGAFRRFVLEGTGQPHSPFGATSGVRPRTWPS